MRGGSEGGAGRRREIAAHVPEDYWYIFLEYATPGAEGKPPRRCEFTWARRRLFDEHGAALLYEACVEDPEALVTKVEAALFSAPSPFHPSHPPATQAPHFL